MKGTYGNIYANFQLKNKILRLYKKKKNSVDISVFSRSVGPNFCFLCKNWVWYSSHAAIVKKNIFFVPFCHFFIRKFLIYPFSLNQVYSDYGKVRNPRFSTVPYMEHWPRMGTGFSVITIYKIPYFSFIIKDLYHVYWVSKDRWGWILL